MRRRLRKKKRLGEFLELGFEVSAELAAGLEPAGFEAFIDRVIEAVEARRLGFAGGGSTRFEGFVARLDRGSATEADREALAAFLTSDAVVVTHQVGPLVDAWRGPFDVLASHPIPDDDILAAFDEVRAQMAINGVRPRASDWLKELDE
jgi:uncharacterized protein YggL (DUF469 family)